MRPSPSAGAFVPGAGLSGTLDPRVVLPQPRPREPGSGGGLSEARRRRTVRPVDVSEVAVGIDAVTNHLLELLDVREAAVALALPDQRVVEVAMALSLRPRLLLLDEPTAGMGDTETEHMVGLMKRLHAEQGVSILFVEHDMDIVFGIAQRITVFDQGRTLADGTPAQISADERVRAAYLGEPV